MQVPAAGAAAAGAAGAAAAGAGAAAAAGTAAAAGAPKMVCHSKQNASQVILAGHAKADEAMEKY